MTTSAFSKSLTDTFVIRLTISDAIFMRFNDSRRLYTGLKKWRLERYKDAF